MPVAARTIPTAACAAPLSVLVEQWHTGLKLRGTAEASHYKAKVETIARACAWRTIDDLVPASIDPWLEEVTAAGKAPSTVNNHLSALSTFLVWCKARYGRPEFNWARGVYRPRNTRGDGSRACTPAELVALVKAAREATEADRRQKKSTRAAQYIVSAYTGLRASELLRLRVGWFDRAADPPRLELPPGARKARKSKRRTLLLHPEAVEAILPLLGNDPDAPIFPTSVDRLSFAADLKRAKIPQIDYRGRKLTFHGLRKAFATNLARFGAGQRAAQALLDHSDPAQTANVYQDEALLPLFAELSKLPRLCALVGGKVVDNTEILEKPAKDLTDPQGIPDTHTGASVSQHHDQPAAGRCNAPAEAPIQSSRVRPAAGDRGIGASLAGLTLAMTPEGIEPSGVSEMRLVAALLAGIQAAARALQQGAFDGHADPRLADPAR